MMPPELQAAVESMLRFGVATLIINAFILVCGAAYSIFALVLIFRAMLVAWRWLGVAEHHVRQHEIAHRTGQSQVWGSTLVALMVGGPAVGASIMALVLGQPSAIIVVLVVALVVGIPLLMAVLGA